MKRRRAVQLLCVLFFVLAINDAGIFQDSSSAALGAFPLEPAAVDAPEARDDFYKSEFDLPLKVDAPGVLANDWIPSGGTAAAVLVSVPRNGSLMLQQDGSFTYTADPDFSGTDRFTYALVDDAGQNTIATVSIDVPEVAPEPEGARIAAAASAFTAPRIAAITDFAETVDGVRLFWEKAYFQDLDIAGAAPMEIPFGLTHPSGYDPGATTRYPLVVFLHGSSSKSNWATSASDPDLRDHSLVDEPMRRETPRFFASAAQTQKPYYAFVLVPHVALKSHYWVGTGPDAPYTQTDISGDTYSEYMHLLENLLFFLTDSANNDSLLSELGLDARDIDSARIYVVGGSDGARGTWDILARHPSFFAGAVASAGTGPKNRLSELLQTPLWSLHGILDDSVLNALPRDLPPAGSGTLGILALLDPSFDNTGSSDLVYKDDHFASDDDPLPADTLIYTEFDESFNHSTVATSWTALTSGVPPWLFAQTRNRPPVAADLAASTPEGTPVEIILSAEDPDGDPLSYYVVTPPAGGILSAPPPMLTYTPDAGFTGTDEFTFKAYDGRDESGLATVTLTVTAILSTVPDAEGLPRDLAEAAIEAAGLKTGEVLMETSDSVPAGCVISQNPAAGTVVAGGSAVDLVVAVEPVTFTLTVESEGPGFGTVDGGGAFEVNTVVTPIAAADPGSLLAGWSPEFCGAPFPLAGDTVCTATFVLDEAMDADGDVAPLGNRDGLVTVLDALVTLRFALGTETPSSEDIVHADVAPLDAAGRPDPDGEVNTADALVILRKAMGLVNW